MVATSGNEEQVRVSDYRRRCAVFELPLQLDDQPLDGTGVNGLSCQCNAGCQVFHDSRDDEDRSGVEQNNITPWADVLR